jgi:hypothetical protein
MGVKNEIDVAPRIVVWYGRAIKYLGVLCLALGIVGAIGNFFTEGGVLNTLLSLFDLWGIALGIYAFGIGVAHGKRWHIFGLLIFIFFGSFVIGLLVMAGRETSVGYYIWAIGGLISLSLILILVVYWEELLDG